MSEWKTDWPKERGIYKCKVDGKPMVLTHHYCVNNNKHWWTTTAGYDVVGCKIEWNEKITIG